MKRGEFKIRSAISCRRVCRAFTLVELLVVVGIIIVVVGISVPAVQALGKGNNLAQSENQIRAYLSQARSLALAERRQVGVVFFDETVSHAMPFHGNQVAMQIFAEDYDQSVVGDKNPRNTFFVQYSTVREYLPIGVAVAGLNDMKGKTVINEDSTGGHDLAILFDRTGQMITRHGIARRNLPSSGTAGTYPWALSDWKFATQGTSTNPNSDNSSTGISSPGLFLYDVATYEAQHIAAGAAGDKAREDWVKRNASVIVVNANTGALLP